MTKRVPEGSRKRNSAAQGLDLWGCGETSHSEKRIVNTRAERHSSKIARTGAVKERKLLRGKVSQGRPHPLRLCVKCEGQTLNKKYSWALGQAFFFLAERWHDFRQNVNVIWHASEGRAEPCRGAFTGCRLCRRAPKLDDSIVKHTRICENI